MLGPRFALYSSSTGDYFFSEIRHLLACGLRERGYDVMEADEEAGFIQGARWHVIVGPQEFFYLGSGNRLRLGPWPPGVILYNAEQPGAGCFSLVQRLLPRAHAIWDMDLKTSRIWARKGWRSHHLPLGWVTRCGLFKPVNKLPGLGLARALGAGLRRHPGNGSWRRRPLDLLFAGSRVPRRRAFFAAAAPLFRRYRSFVRLVSDARFLRPDRAAPLYTKALLGLAQRSKIVLNIHRQETKYFEWHRIALHGIGQGALVISEPTNEAPPFRAGRDFVEAALGEMPETVDYYLSSRQGRVEAERIAAQGLRTYRTSCRLARFLPAALSTLGAGQGAAVRRSRARMETAVALLREHRSRK